MTEIEIVVIIAVLAALVFDFINGFHDAANSVATIVSTRVMRPGTAVLWAAFFNFVAMFIFAPKVADTISKIVIIDAGDSAYIYVAISGLVGAIVWNILTWFWGLPTSSSHALIGGLAGAGVAYAGTGALHWDKLGKAVLFIPLAPMIGAAIGILLMISVYWMFRRWRPGVVDKFFRKGQFFSAAVYSLGHGGNDAQKTMGIIVFLLIAAGKMNPDTQLSLSNPKTLWIILSCHLAMGLGTALGGWRIVETMGMKITKLKPVGGFCAEGAGAITLFLATYAGIPVSTTHTITGAIVGVGSTSGSSAVKWGVAGRIVWAWIFTIPASAAIAAACMILTTFLHSGF